MTSMLASFKIGQDPRYYEDNPGKLSGEYIYFNSFGCQVFNQLEVVVLFLYMAEMYAS